MTKITNNLWIIAGLFSVGLGVLGIFLPLLPTTVFFLLAAYCFARSSPRYYHWLLHNRWFGEYIRNYRQGNGIPLREKLVTLVVLWITILVTAGWLVTAWWARLFLLVVAVGVTAHVASVKTYRRQLPADQGSPPIQPAHREPEQ